MNEEGALSRVLMRNLPASRRSALFFSAFVLLFILLIAYHADPGPAGPSDYFPDSVGYMEAAEAYREFRWEPQETIRDARVLTPLLAAAIPLPLLAAFVAVNAIFIGLSSRILYELGRQWGFGETERWTAVYIFLLVHPAIVYLPTPLADAGMVFFLFLGIYLIQKGGPSWQLAIIFAIAVTAKEACLVLTGVYIFHESFARGRDRYSRIAAVCIPATLVHIALTTWVLQRFSWEYAAVAVALPLILAEGFRLARLNVKYSPAAYIACVAALLLFAAWGTISKAEYLNEQVIGRHNVEMFVSIVPLLPLALLGLIFKGQGLRTKMAYLSPVMVPVILAATWTYMESRMFLVGYPLILLACAAGARRAGRAGRWYLALAIAFYLGYWFMLFKDKYFPFSILESLLG